MTRAMAATPIAGFAFMMSLMLGMFAVQHGFVSDETVRLWAAAAAAGDGDVSIGHIVATYPSIPFLPTVLVALVAPDGAPAPAVVSAGLIALIAGLWFTSFRAAGFPLIAAAIVTLLLAFNPALLGAIVRGPAELCLVLFLYLFGRALYDLRARSTTPEVMAVGLALLGLAFSHPIGAAIAFAAVPFLVFAVRPVLVASSAFNVVVALVFPTVFSVGAFYYVSWVFPGAGWSFFAAPSESLSTWSAGTAGVFGNGFTGLLALDTSLAIVIAIALGAPVAVVALGMVHRRRPLIMPALVFVATMMTAGAITVATGLVGDPSAIAVAAPVLTAIVVARVPVVRERIWLFVSLLGIGWFGGAASLAIIDPATVARVSAMIESSAGDLERLDALALGGATIGHEGILVDTENAPAVVLGRSRARGLFDPPSEPFGLALLFARLDTPFVAVPDPQSNTGANDRLDKAFPALYRRGAPGYRVIYQNTTWRLFAKSGDTRVSKD
jgi:membrane protein XagC